MYFQNCENLMIKASFLGTALTFDHHMCLQGGSGSPLTLHGLFLFLGRNCSRTWLMWWPRRGTVMQAMSMSTLMTAGQLKPVILKDDLWLTRRDSPVESRVLLTMWARNEPMTLCESVAKGWARSDILCENFDLLIGSFQRPETGNLWRLWHQNLCRLPWFRVLPPDGCPDFCWLGGGLPEAWWMLLWP